MQSEDGVLSWRSSHLSSGAEAVPGTDGRHNDRYELRNTCTHISGMNADPCCAIDEAKLCLWESTVQRPPDVFLKISKAELALLGIELLQMIPAEHGMATRLAVSCADYGGGSN